jgi:hypothetical protein
MQLTLFNQRWRDRRDSYRPAGEPIDTTLYEVAELAEDREAKRNSDTSDTDMRALKAHARFSAGLRWPAGKSLRFLWLSNADLWIAADFL